MPIFELILVVLEKLVDEDISIENITDEYMKTNYTFEARNNITLNYTAFLLDP